MLSTCRGSWTSEHRSTVEQYNTDLLVKLFMEKYEQEEHISESFHNASKPNLMSNALLQALAFAPPSMGNSDTTSASLTEEQEVTSRPPTVIWLD